MSLLAKDLAVECLAVGSKTFANPPLSLPRPDEYGALGISEVINDGGTVSIRCGYTVQALGDFSNSLLKVIDDFAPDVIWTQLDGVEGIVRAARMKGTKTILYLRDAEDAPAMLKSLAKAGICIVCNSQFMAERVKRITGRAAHVIYPSLDFKLGVNGDPQGYITMINPHRVKGIDTFLEIARLLPSERFLLVESWTLSDSALTTLQGKLAVLPNVIFSRRVPDVQDIYKQTKLLLVPSVWEEAFGRVVIEAQSCKIPVVASQRGGLPEAVNDGGICVQDYLNPKEWVTTIQHILRDDNIYRELARRAHAHAFSEIFSTQYAASRFLDICSDGSCYEPSFGHRVRTFIQQLSGNRQA